MLVVVVQFGEILGQLAQSGDELFDSGDFDSMRGPV